MKRRPRSTPRDRWSHHDAVWRDPVQVANLWSEAESIEPRLLTWRATGNWWEALEKARVTLLVTREYEHLAMALRVVGSRPEVTYWPLPHPSGIAVDRRHGRVFVASTRNPNQVFQFESVGGTFPRREMGAGPDGRPLVPVASRFYPGCLYLHDLAFVGGRLHANAVGQNVVVRLDPDGSHPPVWWPRAIETTKGPRIERNYIQLNSIAAGSTLASSFFTASTDRISTRRPGHRNFAVDRRGVVFSGRSREPIARGLTRPHSARLFRDSLWVANSGYGELGVVEDGRFLAIDRFDGWTRGLCLVRGLAFVATSRVIPAFRDYAPGLDVDKSRCGLHVLDIRSKKRLGTLIFPDGNQIFAVDWTDKATGFPLSRYPRKGEVRSLFYSFRKKGNA